MSKKSKIPKPFASVPAIPSHRRLPREEWTGAETSVRPVTALLALKKISEIASGSAGGGGRTIRDAEGQLGANDGERNRCVHVDGLKLQSIAAGIAQGDRCGDCVQGSERRQ